MLIVVEQQDAQGMQTAWLPDGDVAPGSAFLSLCLVPRPTSLAGLRRAIRKVFGPLVHVSDLADVLVAVGEAVANAVGHGGSARVVVSLRLQGDLLNAVVQDAGPGFDPHRVDVRTAPAPEATGGRGLYLISRVVDTASLASGSGTMVRMWKRVRRRDGHWAHPDNERIERSE